MKKTLFITAILSFLALQAPSASAQQPDAIFKLMRHEWTVNADGTSDYHYRHEVQILRNRALTAYADKGETFVVYNPDIEELTVNEVYTIQLDGTRVDMPQNAFIYQLPSECADCGRFNHLRELAMVHTGMEIGCRIVVDYTIHRQYNLLHESLPLQRECPVEKMEIVVNNNTDFNVNFDIYGMEFLTFQHNTTQKPGSTRQSSTTHTFTNIPQAPREPFMPADIVPTMRIYNGTPQHTPAFDNEDFADASMLIRKKIDSDDDRTITTMIRDFVIDNIHLNDIHPSHLGYIHSTPREVWRSGCGTATDKAVLLAAILNHERFEARVIGEDYDQVGVMIDTVEYCLDVRSKHTPVEVNGKAVDEMTTYDTTGTADAAQSLDTIEEGFYRLPVFFPLAGEPAIRASQLALQRTTPLMATACDVRSDMTYTLPKNLKMVGGDIEEHIDYPGIGSLSISVKQSGKKLKVTRSLKIEKSRIDVDEYAHFRHLLATWQQFGDKDILFRTK